MCKKTVGKIVGVVVAGSAVAATNAMAAIDVNTITLDTANPEALAAKILAGLAVLWGIRKLIKLTNRS